MYQTFLIILVIVVFILCIAISTSVQILKKKTAILQVKILLELLDKHQLEEPGLCNYLYSLLKYDLIKEKAYYSLVHFLEKNHPNEEVYKQLDYPDYTYSSYFFEYYHWDIRKKWLELLLSNPKLIKY